MKQSIEIKILPLDQWKAARVIEFTIEGIKAHLVYLRPAALDSLRFENTEDYPASGYNSGRHILPLDDIDYIILNWFKRLDRDAFFTFNYLINVDSREEILINQYSGIPTKKVEIKLVPDFNCLDPEYLMKFENKTYPMFGQSFHVHVFGSLHQETEITIFDNYDVENFECIKGIMHNIDHSITVI